MSNDHEEPRTDKTGNIYNEPPNLIQFVSTEHQQFLTTLVNCREEMDFLAHVHGLYAAAMSNQTADVSRIIIFQLLTLIHYHFLFACSCYMRCHMSEAFNSARVAIDGALIAATIIHDRSVQTSYIDRTHPFDKLLRYYKNLIRDKKELPHLLVEHLVKMHDFCSQFASHADVQTFAHRLDFIGAPEVLMSVGYFQFPRPPEHMKGHFLGLLHIFVVTLDIFSDFFVNEHKSLPSNWRDELRIVGRRIEDRQKMLMPTVTEEKKKIKGHNNDSKTP